MMYLETVVPALVPKIPMLLLWLAGIVLAVFMLRRGGAKAEKLLLAGCAINFVLSTCGVVYAYAYLMSERLRGGLRPGGWEWQLFGWSGIALGLAGFVCLILAFWMKFRSSLRSDSKLKGGE